MTSQQDVLRRLSEIVKAHRHAPEMKKYPQKMMRIHGPDTSAQVLIHVPDAQLREEGLAAVECFYHLAVLPSFAPVDLGPIHHIATSSNRRLREIGVQLLLALGVHHAPAREVLFELLSASKVAIRFTMITFFENPALPNFPQDFVERVIAKGLQDVTPKVRTFAALSAYVFGTQQIYQKSIRENLIPELIDHLKSEKDEIVLRELVFAILRVGEGYELCETAKNEFVLIRSPKEGVSCELIGRIGLSRPFVQSIVDNYKGWGETIPAVPT